ncbi:rab3 GTPase-activating protein non-catalytic subunit-like isoform X1 [Biomphalaria glabrata]|uniref:Rab3 GTPase-activating protein non-catalytic subunit-like isoform X1 n=1 Tax=Biomphalaria glabrata TaxID=6526 RepID=A0A9W2ZVZ8_BIOGL|nr:rab3 GTPase-activating protein non-catalytic subunit-like isoform X1 [Biomphalaria glabrata]
MSCQLLLLSKFQDIASVRRFFFPSLSKEGTPNKDVDLNSTPADLKVDNDGWEQDWGFDDQEVTTETSNVDTNGDKELQNKWLQNCLLSLSPTNDVLAIAHENKICVLTQKWDPKKKGEEIDSSLTPVWEGVLGLDERETISAVLCLPLSSQKRSTQGGPDWTCIIVGFSSGFVRMYTQNGVLLLSQLLHMEKVERLKCRTYSPPRFLGLSETHDELLIMYTKSIVSIDGFSLVQSLRACCNQVARATASGTENLLQPPPLEYKKWFLAEQEQVCDYVACGVACANPFDQLKAASMLGGVKASVKTSPPTMSVFMTSGNHPYVGFFYAIEGFTQPILSEVAIAMANKIKSAILSAASGWLGFGGKAKEEKEKPPKIEPATPLPLRFGLPDKRRVGENIILSPNNNYAATTDSFGRVILIDVQRGVAVRMWKGYRDAQLGWVEVKEENVEPCKNHDLYRLAQFLIIYAPRRGILEVWLAAHGPRVAAFNVSKSSCLICPCYGMMGLNNVTCKGVKSKAFLCALIDPDGMIKTIHIPFHLALSDKSIKRARDLHLLKKLKAFLKESAEDREGLEETILQLLLDMKVASIAHQALERVLSTKYLPIQLMQKVVRACIKKLESRAKESLDLDSRIMLMFCKAQKSLMTLYSSVSLLNNSEPEPQKLSQLEILTDILHLSPTDASVVVNVLSRYDLMTSPSSPTKQSSRVQFSEDVAKLPVTSFLHAFSYRTLHTKEDDSKATSAFSDKQISVTVSKEASEERQHALGEFLFGGCLHGKCQAQEIMAALQQSNLPPNQLLNLLMMHWLSVGRRSLNMLVGLYELVKSITALADVSEVVVDSNTSSTWWQHVRNMCSQSEHCYAAYLAVLTCKAVAAEALGIRSKAKDPDADSASTTSDDNEQQDMCCASGDASLDSQDWESLTVDMELWEVLYRQFEDIMAISTLIHLSVNMEQPITVSVSKLLNSGKGSIPEVIARYIVQQQLNPASLFFTFTIQESTENENSLEGVYSGQNETQKVKDKRKSKVECKKEIEKLLLENITEMSYSDRVKYQLEELRQRFPHSLQNDILLANCCWEYAVVWNKDPEITQNLDLSLEFLRLVQNAVLRQGVSSLLWHMFIQKRAAAAAHLMEKVGKPPKDRLCRKEVGVTDSTLVTFISLCADFMEILMDANCEANEVPVCNTEHAWQKMQGPTSLVELAIDQKATNYGLLRVHYHLLKIMSAVLALKMKSVKVLSLFDSKGRAALFKDLHAHPLLPSQKVDQDLLVARKNFLCRVISSAVATIDPPASSPSIGGSSPAFKKHRSLYSSAFKWPQVALNLTRDFGLDVDFMKRYHVCELYSYGHDKFAEEVMTSVTEHEELGLQLLTVAGQRVAYEIFKRDIDANFQHLAGMSVTLTRWLSTLDPTTLHYPLSPLSWTVTLLEQAASRLSESSKDHELALELLEKTKILASFSNQST